MNSIHVSGRTVGLVLHFRTPALTLACLESLRNQGIGVVVVVDNSEDQGKSIAEMSEALEVLVEGGLFVEVVAPDLNLGFSAGVAAGLDVIRSYSMDNVLLINSDATLGSGALGEMEMMLEPGGVVVPYVSSTGENLRPSVGFYHRWLALYLAQKKLGAFIYPSGCCVLVSKDLLCSRLFDCDFFFYGEDVYLGYELLESGASLGICKNAVVHHSGNASSRSGSMFYEYHINRSHWQLARKLTKSRVGYLFALLFRCFTLAARACARSLRSRSLLPWQALLQATADLAVGRCRSHTPTLDQVTASAAVSRA